MTRAREASPEADIGQDIQKLSTPEVYGALTTSPKGLTEAEAEERLWRFGRNVIREVGGKPLFIQFLANFTHMMAILLWVGGVVALIGGMHELAIAIWMVNLINGAFSFWQEYRAEKATRVLRQLLPQHVSVLRDGEKQSILAEELVPGDVMLLAEGDRISADGRVVDEAELRVDQSTLSGESHPVRKTREAVLRTRVSRFELRNLVFAGTSVVAGEGTAVVFATGMDTEFGKVANLTQSVRDEPSPLQKELIHVTRWVSLLAVSAGLAFFAVLLALPVEFSLADSFIFALGMIVCFVPEGLLPTVSLSLAMGVQRMAARHALIKRLSAVETLGCTTVICTDKTGTLTENEMTVSNLWLAGHHLTVTGTGYAPEGRILERGHLIKTPVDGDLRRLLVAGLLCNNARLLPPNSESPRWATLGDPTEAALLVAALKGGLHIEAEKEWSPRLRELPFESARKRMSTIHRVQNSLVAYAKGAPTEILALCAGIRMNGQDQPLDDGLRAQITAINDEYARGGLRVLAVAMRSLPEKPGEAGKLIDYSSEAIEHDLTFLGLVAMMDPPRPEVRAAVEKCHRAGIRIVMITGDYGITAENIARRIGIIRSSQPRIINGSDLDGMDDAALKEALQDEVLFARTAPGHKLRIVSVLQDMGHVVAVTGDGVNDAPALKKANIGVAMGIAGTDVAKEAADMILTDDNFASIVNAVEEGRAVYANAKKFITFIFTSNAAEATPFIFFAFSGGRIPLGLTVMQVLSIDLGADIVPGLALGADPPEEGIMDKPPRSLKEHVITRSLLLRAFVCLGLVQGLVAMVAFFFQYWRHGYGGQWLDLPSEGGLYQSATAMVLAAIVVTQMGNLFAQRSEHTSVFRSKLFGNRLLWVALAVALAVVCIVIYVPFFQRLFGTQGFAASNWLFLLALSPLVLLADEVRKLVIYLRERHIVRR
ncbi:MAG: cation-transporting P-type ATPase [Chloroflexi bacterium]|nr:cation-transporting P-type ATPase [Chloroflexota bacterium]